MIYNKNVDFSLLSCYTLRKEGTKEVPKGAESDGLGSK